MKTKISGLFPEIGLKFPIIFFAATILLVAIIWSQLPSRSSLAQTLTLKERELQKTASVVAVIVPAQAVAKSPKKLEDWIKEKTLISNGFVVQSDEKITRIIGVFHGSPWSMQTELLALYKKDDYSVFVLPGGVMLFNDGRQVEAEMVAASDQQGQDIALYEIPTGVWPTLQLQAPGAEIETEDEVRVVSHILNGSELTTFIFRGRVAAVRGSKIYLDINSMPGMSGSPVILLKTGKAIGILTDVREGVYAVATSSEEIISVLDSRAAQLARMKTEGK